MNCLVYKMSENNEKCFQQFPEFQGDILKMSSFLQTKHKDI